MYRNYRQEKLGSKCIFAISIM